MRKRADLTHQHQLDQFLTWLLGKATQPELTHTYTGRTFRRHTEWCWQISPSLPRVTTPARHVLIDGTWIGSWCLLIATDEHQRPLAWQWCARESTAAWTALLNQLPAPHTVTCDGGTGVRAALRDTWPHTRVQRCIFHVWTNLRTHLTLHPRTPAGQALLGLGKHLRNISTIDDATDWLHLLNHWHQLYGHLTTERTYAKQRLRNGLWDSPNGKRWWYTHERLRRAYRLLVDLHQRGLLFTYLDTDCPKTTSRLEGGINAQIKATLRHHRGMSTDHRKRAAEWVLIERAGHLSTAMTVLDPHANNTRDWAPSPQSQSNDPAPGPALYDNGITAEEGLWHRTGWAGNH